MYGHVNSLSVFFRRIAFMAASDSNRLRANPKGNRMETTRKRHLATCGTWPHDNAVMSASIILAMPGLQGNSKKQMLFHGPENFQN